MYLFYEKVVQGGLVYVAGIQLIFSIAIAPSPAFASWWVLVGTAGTEAREREREGVGLVEGEKVRNS